MISLSWDLFIILCFAIATVYGFISQKDRLTVILFASYAGIVVTNIWGEYVYNIVAGRGQLLGNFAANASVFTISAALYVFIIMLMAVRSGLAAEKPRESAFSFTVMGILGFFTAGLILSSIISFMPEGMRENLITTSRLAAQIWKYHTLWTIFPVAILVFKSIVRR